MLVNRGPSAARAESELSDVDGLKQSDMRDRNGQQNSKESKTAARKTRDGVRYTVGKETQVD